MPGVDVLRLGSGVGGGIGIWSHGLEMYGVADGHRIATMVRQPSDSVLSSGLLFRQRVEYGE
jgi:hypothetical protein